MMRRREQLGARDGFSLLEVLAAVMIAATLAAIAVTQFRPHATRGHDRACTLIRETMQTEVDRYSVTTGILPRSDMRQLTAPEYWGAPVPVCPVDGSVLRLDRSGRVTCASHP